jgi:hypothetical protein
MICYLIDRIVATRAPGRLLCYYKFAVPFTSTRTSFLIFKSQLHQSSFVMGDNSKSETEWRAILSPEQVRSSTILVDVYMYVDSTVQIVQNSPSEGNRSTPHRRI